MNPNQLQIFHSNEIMREQVKDFLIEQLRELAIERVFGKQAISGIYEARKVITLAFDRMDELFTKQKKGTIQSSR